MYRNKFTPEQALREIKLRMKYDSKKTLNENLESLNEVDISGDIRDLKDEISSFNSDEASIIKILQNYKSKNDFDKLAKAYKEKYGTDIGVAIYSVINSNDPTESQQLKDWAKTIGIDAKAVPTNDKRGTFQWTLTSGVSAPSTAEVDKDKDVVTKDNQIVKKDGTVTNPTAPADLDVKKFQDWLDNNKGEWAWSQKQQKNYKVEQNPNRGYGRFGPSTQKMWNDPKVKEEYLKSLQGADKNNQQQSWESGNVRAYGMTPDEYISTY